MLPTPLAVLPSVSVTTVLGIPSVVTVVEVLVALNVTVLRLLATFPLVFPLTISLSRSSGTWMGRLERLGEQHKRWIDVPLVALCSYLLSETI